ncbi:MAG: DUF4097 domain-containing protein [candidate division KSB1 bacterium]|nr:DUF4097 domain-containing protein [candidate division KSB1 bacterium]MDZ7274697.1 DUF4097 domain-containing protein [candidate division KSB1 bacterium]MDZ7285522.1 DUF4097 domain-containing protein [candidate division KSB1 bacterium]MDZ7298554.1 DUF4097 domain-containing protein [candidate division KSB1 bacterium]MDZ7306594.1 DUF4097 domain-containing protein [candidate division KSB1 bacterium]
MPHRTNIWRSGILLAWLVLPLLAVAQEERSEKSFTVKPGGWLELRADFGSVEVTSWAKDEVRVEVTKRVEGRSQRRASELFKDYEITYNQTANGVAIVAKMYGGSRRWWGGNDGLQVEFRLSVPQKYNLDLNTAGGSISVDNLIGEARLKTSGGSLTLGRIEGPVDARTSGGSITVGEVDGEVEVETSGGSISVDGAGGSLRAHTSGGGVTLRRLRGSVTASTSGGSLSAELLEQFNAPCDLSTSGGGISVYLAPGIKADVDARTSGGEVESDLPITVQGAIGEGKLQGKLNGGGPLLTLRTSGGDIRLRSR